MMELLKKSAVALISGFVLIVIVTLKLLGLKLEFLGIIGFAAMIILLISSFKSIFLSDEATSDQD
jgi:hypothetical protein